MGYLAVDASFEHTLLVVGHIGQHRREMRPAVFLVAHLGKQFLHIGPGVMSRAGIARAVNARSSPQGVDHQSRVVGNARDSVMFMYIAGLLKGIPFKSSRCLRYILITSDIRQRHKFNFPSQDFPGFL